MRPNDPLFSLQWYLENTGQAGGTPGIDIDVLRVWDDYNGLGVRIGVYDDGVETEGAFAHPDLVGNYDPALEPVIAGQVHNGQPVDNRSGSLGDNHGTAVAGIIAASGNNNLGVIGIAWGAKFATVKVLGAGGDDPIVGPANHQRLLSQTGFDVVNHSWGMTKPFLPGADEWEAPALFGRGGLGTVVIKSAGNDRDQQLDQHGAVEIPPRDSNDQALNVSRYATVVGALLNTGYVAEYSTPGANLLISASAGPLASGPDQDITTDRVGPLGYNTSGDYTPFNGTSAAGPVVSGVAALMLQANSHLGWRDAQAILAYSARHVGSAVDGTTTAGFELTPWHFNNANDWNGAGLHYSRDYGFGMVDAHAAVRLAETWNIAVPTAATGNNERYLFQEVGPANTTTGDVILANGGTLSRQFSLSGNVKIEDVALGLQLQHPDVSGLKITLIAPSGTRSDIWVAGRYVTTPATTTALDTPWTMSSREFYGESAAGTWTLEITNLSATDARIANTDLTTYGADLTTNNHYIYTDEFAAYGGLTGRATLSDHEGVDTFDAAAVKTDSIIDLTPGTSHTKIGGIAITIDSGTVITNAIGGDGNDTITGNAAANILFGGRGNDTIQGVGHNDTAQYLWDAGKYTPMHFGSLIRVTGPEGNDTLHDVSFVKFADGTINPDDGNALIDSLFYLARNADVFHAGRGAVDHYNSTGWTEGRDPNGYFSTRGYLSANPDVARAGINPLDQYDTSGWKDGRDPSASFDTKLYLLHNPDVAAAGVDPLAHFMQFGAAEGRSAYAAVGPTIVAGFDAEFYLLGNADVGLAGANAAQHYNTYGWHEGRNPDAYFDTAGYLARYADVAAAGVNPLDHYIQNGWLEGRDPSGLFDTKAYLAANADVAAAHINPLEHFLQHGIYEGRLSYGDGVFA
jgi:subtilisin-like proprotein convertase family protein